MCGYTRLTHRNARVYYVYYLNIHNARVTIRDRIDVIVYYYVISKEREKHSLKL